MIEYRKQFFWSDDPDLREDPRLTGSCYRPELSKDPEQVLLDDERFKVAYGLATSGGSDLQAGAQWVCGLAVALRGYFNFYNRSAQLDKGYWISYNLWGGPTAPVTSIHLLNNRIAQRYKEASGINLIRDGTNALNYASTDAGDCIGRVQQEIEKQNPPSGKKLIPSLMHKPDPEQLFMKEDMSDIDFTTKDYWVYYNDGYWHPWATLGRVKPHEPTAAGFKNYVLCRAPVWAGNYVAYTTNKQQRYQMTASYSSSGKVELRHPLQPQSAKYRDPKLIAEYKQKYCPQKR